MKTLTVQLKTCIQTSIQNPRIQVKEKEVDITYVSAWLTSLSAFLNKNPPNIHAHSRPWNSHYNVSKFQVLPPDTFQSRFRLRHTISAGSLSSAQAYSVVRCLRMPMFVCKKNDPRGFARRVEKYPRQLPLYTIFRAHGVSLTYSI